VVIDDPYEREELALALVDKRQARAYENKHGVDPRSPGDLLLDP
jgi:hypothetical protein